MTGTVHTKEVARRLALRLRAGWARITLRLVCWMLLLTANANAGDLPKQGSMNLLNCWVGEAPLTMTFSKEYQLGTLSWTGAMWNSTPGGAFDAMSGECGGHYSVAPEGVDAFGQCQFADADGHKMLVSVPKNHNGSGAWHFVAGTGKYAGIAGGGEFKPLRQFPPAITQGKALVCNAITGSYSIK